MWNLLSRIYHNELVGRVRRQYVIDSQYRRIAALPRKSNFARYLRDARIRRGLSVAEVAEQVGVSTASIYFWERDHCRPRDENLSALCKVLKLPVRATREMAAAW
jgi:DNA-binding XRE family transcriptional regulator